ncbi:hAT-like transposase RNase-H fold [Arabidopsis thaliana x Arabidopsis arenosa]|uniref:HAT-like transposase RNase-H fold n=1 Tax=Arabidopsis thaliana x Arabidopsis arenosa TaxID=1240361 RepID=A0A8T2E671_9BRAS|nr:hAT-like transposase RNase-H fold [Arabidopsis thaliana x Arabidopsis arenosa]
MVITTHYVDAYWKLKKLIIGFKYVTDHKVNITTNLRIHRNSFDSDLKKKAKDMYENFDKYWDGLKNIKMWIVATVFDPRKKMQFGNLCFADLYSEGSTNAKVLYESVYDILVDMFKEYTGRYGKATDVQDSQSQSSQSTQEKQAETELGVEEDPSYPSIDKRYNALLNVIGVKQTKNELYSYLKEHVENPVLLFCSFDASQATRSYEGYWLLLSVFAVVKSHEERTQFENIEHVMNFMKRVELPVELRNSIPWIVWGLLKARNSSVYADRVNDHNIVIATTLEEAEEWSTQNSVASQENCSLGDVLFHARDSFLPMINRIEAELRCIQWSLQSLHDLHIESCEVWSDCASALQALASPEEWPKYRSQLNSSREPYAPLRSHE